MDIPAQAVNDFVPPKEERNREIYRRFLAGARAVDLAELYHVSLQRVYALIHRQNKR
jgi:Mor family transcriptional regulator